jgi:hypothetical protein
LTFKESVKKYFGWIWNEYFRKEKSICRNTNKSLGKKYPNVKVSNLALVKDVLTFVSFGMRQKLRHMSHSLDQKMQLVE